MAATIEIKYYNSFWLKKLPTITQVSQPPVTPALTIGVAAIGSNTLTIVNSNAVNIGIGQEVSYTISSIDYVYTVINKVVGGTNTVITLSALISGADVPNGTTLTFGDIVDNAWLPGRYESGANDWYIEESRIRGGYNNTSVDLGVKAYIVEESPQREHLISSLIYSGVFNSRTGVNNTNQFSVAEDITRSSDPSKGSIQKLYAEDTNLNIFQELKVSRALIDKDAVYSADGQPMTTSGIAVIGQIQSYAGNYGIGQHPESFAVYGYRKYFVDDYQNLVLRLSQDGITEISAYGMFDYFRDQLSNTNLTDGFIYGMWDIHSKQYVLSIQPNPGNKVTLSFDEDVQGWPSLLSYIPNGGISLRNNFYTVNNGKFWQHYSESVPKASFYNANYKSNVTFVFNPSVSMSKTFLTINYEGSSNWRLETMYTETDTAAPIAVNLEATTLAGLQDQLFQNNFKKKENKYFSNLLNITAAQRSEVIWGQSMAGIKGFFATATMTCDNGTVVSNNAKAELFAVSAEYVESSY